MDVNKGENIEFSLQLIKSDGESVEEDATISYSIYNSSATVQVVTSQTATYNSITQSYIDTLSPSASWINQEVGHYLVVWSVADTDDNFNSVYTEQLNINIDENDIIEINTNVLGVSGDVQDVSTQVLGVSADVVDVNTNVLGVSADIVNMQLDVDQILTNTITISGNIASMQLDVDQILTNTITISGGVNDMELKIDRILGLVHENVYIDQTVFDDYGNLVNARLRIYENSADVGSNNSVLATYRIVSSPHGPGKFTTWKHIRV